MLHTLIPPAIFFSTELVYTMQRKSAIINLKDCAEWRISWKKWQASPLTISSFSPVSMYPARITSVQRSSPHFDLRMTSPNEEPVMNTAEVHTIEHLGATCRQSSGIQGQDRLLRLWDAVPAYLLLAGDLSSKDIVPPIGGNV